MGRNRYQSYIVAAAAAEGELGLQPAPLGSVEGLKELRGVGRHGGGIGVADLAGDALGNVALQRLPARHRESAAPPPAPAAPSRRRPRAAGW